MDYAVSIAINAPPERVWAVLTDVRRWPEWTASMRDLRYVAGDSLVPGSRVRIQQPRLPAVVWDVTEVEPGESFSWVARSPGITTRATHRLTPGLSGGVTVSLGIQQRGPLAWLLELLTARLTRRYVQLEADGLKRRCEAASS